MQSHFHQVNAVAVSGTGGNGLINSLNTSLGKYNTDAYGGGDSQNLQPYQVVNFVIKT